MNPKFYNLPVFGCYTSQLKKVKFHAHKQATTVLCTSSERLHGNSNGLFVLHVN